jgi:transposase
MVVNVWRGGGGQAFGKPQELFVCRRRFCCIRQKANEVVRQIVRDGNVESTKAFDETRGQNLRFPHYMTTAQDGGKVVSLTHRPP